MNRLDWIPEVVRDAMFDAPQAKPLRVTYAELRRAVAHEYGVSVEDIGGARRLAHIVEARHALWRRLRAQGWSLLAIAAAAGRDHTTVLQALRKPVRVRVAT